MRRFGGKVALVTGGASGIGLATALRLAEEGATVVIGDIDSAAGERVAASHARLSFIQTDVSDSASVQSLIAAIVDRHGRLDVAHANAGFDPRPMLLHQTPDESFERAVAVNTRGVFFVCKFAIAHMRERGGGGALCCTSSALADASFAKAGVYSISKAAVNAIVRTIAVEYATRGIRANAILPAATSTPMIERGIAEAVDPAAQRAVIEGRQTMKRLGEPAEVAAAVAFLLSDDASFITGASVPVDGGSLSALPGPDVLTLEELWG